MENKYAAPSLSLALTYFNAWVNGDFQRATDCLSAKAEFDVPINHYADKEAFMQAVIYTAGQASDVKLISAMGTETEAILLYDFRFGAIGAFRIAEHFVVQDGSIVLIRHIHDTYPIRMLNYARHSPS